MKPRAAFHNSFSGALLALTLLLAPAPALAGPSPAETAQTEALDALFAELQSAPPPRAAEIEAEIWRLWSQSGSPSADFLLQRGQAAMAAGDLTAAIEHLTALTDHAPGFAEGWNARATAYFQTGQWGPSLADIRRTLALNPRHFGALMGLGMIFEGLGQPERALDAYRAALSIHPQLGAAAEAVLRLEAATGGQGI